MKWILYRCDQDWLGVIVFSLFLAVVFIIAPNIPIVDYPNHLARQWIITHLQSDAALQDYYHLNWRLVPNLALDLIVPPVAALIDWLLSSDSSPQIGVEIAMRIFLFASLVMTAVGTILLLKANRKQENWITVKSETDSGTAFKTTEKNTHPASRRIHDHLQDRGARLLLLLWPWLLFSTLIGRSLLWGFMNFLFATGLAMIGFALWVTWREVKPWRAICALSLVSPLVYLSHFEAFGCLVVLVGSYELGYGYFLWRDKFSNIGKTHSVITQILRRLSQSALVFLVPMIIFAVKLVSSHQEAGSRHIALIHYGNFLRKFDLPFAIFKTYFPPLDAINEILIFLVIAFGLWKKILVLSERMVFPLVIMTIVYLVMPESIMTATLVDQRLPFFVVILLLCASNLKNCNEVIQPQPSAAKIATANKKSTALDWLQKPISNLRKWLNQQVNSSRLLVMLVAVTAAIFLIRLGYFGYIWNQQSGEVSAARQLFKNLPAGAKVIVAIDPQAFGISHAHLPLDHVATWLVIDRSALVYGLFVAPSQQPLRYNDPYANESISHNPRLVWRSLFDPEENLRIKFDAMVKAVRGFDYLLIASDRAIPALLIEQENGTLVNLPAGSSPDSPLKTSLAKTSLADKLPKFILIGAVNHSQLQIYRIEWQ